MGQFHFIAPSHVQVPIETLASAYLAGMEGIPWRSANRWNHPKGASPVAFSLERSIRESGNLNIPWDVEGLGELTLSTASLMETSAPYNLPLELARGVVNRLRNQAAEWGMAGLAVSTELANELREASNAFIAAVTSLPDHAKTVAASEQAIRLGLQVGESLCREYASQALAARHEEEEHRRTLLGCRLGSRPLEASEAGHFISGFNTAAVPFTWRAVEQNAGKHEWDIFDQQITWCQEHGLRVIGGPLLQLDEQHLPDWLYLWEDDFEQVRNYVTQYIQATVNRYRGRVNVWNCAARMNVGGAISLTEEQRLRLMVAAIDELRRNDPQTAILLSFDQPWAEYLATNDHDLSPLHLADSLVRADLGITGIGIELNIGYQHVGAARRELVEYSRQLDRWAVLQLPMIVYVSCPSDSGNNPHARRAVRATSSVHTPESQAAFASKLIPLMLAKQYVQGIVWNDLSDAAPHEFANAGVIDASGTAKPLLDTLIGIRKQHLT
ncbi:MAG: endo-1,4-beta-xylanase [Planctomycetota bacterium]|nr:endo-1,4-beta-xylanase [Planctomycetota bacterium]